MHIEHIGVYAKDTAGLAGWYANALQLREVRRIERGDGRMPVLFLQGEDGAVVEFLPTDETADRRELKSPGFTHLGIVVDDLNEEVARLKSLGVEVRDIRETSNGWTIGYFDDPEGNILELVQR